MSISYPLYRKGVCECLVRCLFLKKISIPLAPLWTLSAGKVTELTSREVELCSHSWKCHLGQHEKNLPLCYVCLCLISLKKRKHSGIQGCQSIFFMRNTENITKLVFYFSHFPTFRLITKHSKLWRLLFSLHRTGIYGWFLWLQAGKNFHMHSCQNYKTILISEICYGNVKMPHLNFITRYNFQFSKVFLLQLFNNSFFWTWTVLKNKKLWEIFP